MTSNQLIEELSLKFRLGEWPKRYEVDAETYGNCCQHVFRNAHDIKWGMARIALGPARGLMFKNVELILETN